MLDKILLGSGYSREGKHFMMVPAAAFEICIPKNLTSRYDNAK